jgi:hypothetical protein
MRPITACHSSALRSRRVAALPCWWQKPHCSWKWRLRATSPRSSAPSHTWAGRLSARRRGSVFGLQRHGHRRRAGWHGHFGIAIAWLAHQQLDRLRPCRPGGLSASIRVARDVHVPRRAPGPLLGSPRRRCRLLHAARLLRAPSRWAGAARWRGRSLSPWWRQWPGRWPGVRAGRADGAWGWAGWVRGLASARRAAARPTSGRTLRAT